MWRIKSNIIFTGEHKKGCFDESFIYSLPLPFTYYVQFYNIYNWVLHLSISNISRTTHTKSTQNPDPEAQWADPTHFTGPGPRANSESQPHPFWLSERTRLTPWIYNPTPSETAGSNDDQLWPQQFKYITCRRESSVWPLLSSPPAEETNPSISAPEKGRRSAEKKRFLPWLTDLRPDLSFCPCSEWLLTTATLAAIHTLFM